MYIVDQTFSVVPEITALLSGSELACDSGGTFCEVKNIGNGTLNWVSAVQVNWAKVVPSSGTIDGFSSQTLSLVYEANTTRDERFFSITFSSDEAINKYASLRLSQPKCTSTLCLQDSAKQVSAVSGTCSFYISNCGGDQFNWQLAENSDWFRVEPANGFLQKGQSAAITIFYDENLLPNERSGTVTVNAENAFDSPQTFKLTQDEYGKPLDEGETNILEEGERIEDDVISYTLSDNSSGGCVGLSLKSQLTSLDDWLLGGLAVMLLFVISAGKGF